MATSGHRALTSRLGQAAAVAGHALRHGYLVGRCPLCRAQTLFYLKGPSIRAHLRCARCDSRPRQRALVEVLNREFPDWRGARIHESSPGHPTLGFFRRECAAYTASYFYPDVPRGDSRDGCRSETLEAQTFADASFDLVITQDVMEHVLDPARAFAEIARTLRPGGAHVFTLPWFYWRPTRIRARARPDGSVEHLVPAEYHGGPIGGGSLVVTDWGRDLLGFVDACAATSTEVFLLDEASLGITGAHRDVFVSRKHAA
jgi:SAM-dependent methyltransferase